MDFVLPPRCLVTGDVVESSGMLAPGAWAGLSFITQPYCETCGFPFDFAVPGVQICLGCQANPPLYDTARSALRYDDASRPLLLGFKHGDKTHGVVTFVPWLQRAGADALNRADYIIPVPLHPLRLLRRRYNQAALLARAIAAEQKDGARYAADILKRTRATPVQGHLKRAQRAANVKGAFAVPQKWRAAVRSKNIVLVDDVLTTGATVNACAKVLRKAGAARIDVLTLARVVMV